MAVPVRPHVGDYVHLPAWCDPVGPLRVLGVDEVTPELLRLSGYCVDEQLAQHQGVWLVPAEQVHAAPDPVWPPRKPPQPCTVRLAGGRRFYVIISRYGDAGRVILRGWYLDGTDRTVQYLELDSAQAAELTVETTT